jgi:Rod binding domain-containing protein
MKSISAAGVGMEPQTDFQKQKLKKACEDFEAIMVTYLFKSMRETALKADSEDFGGGGKDLYEGMMDETLATQLSHQGELGLAKLLYQQLAPGRHTEE